jgi:multidrug efflux system membrane fusion protein
VERRLTNSARPRGTDRRDLGPSLRAGGRWFAVLLLLAGAYAASACGPSRAQGTKGEPAHLESIEGSDLKRVVVTARAAERIGLETTPVREESIRRTRTVGGEVVLEAGSRASVRLRLSSSELSRIDREQPAVVTRRSGAPATARSLTARAARSPTAITGPVAELHYTVNEPDHGLSPGERVFVKLPLVGGATVRKLVPYAAVLYDLKGLAWTYTQVAPLAFVRVQLTVDFMDGNLAVLSDGPPAGTLVVTAGATELFGTEVKVGK